MSGLTNYVDNKTYKLSIGRKPAYDPQGIAVGRTSIIGYPYLRNANMKPIDALVQDARKSDTARLGESSSLPDRRMTTGEGMHTGMGYHTGGKHCNCAEPHGNDGVCSQCGGSFFKKFFKGAKKVGKFIKKKKLISKGAKLGATIATALGQPEIAAPLATVGEVASTIGFGIPTPSGSRGVLSDDRFTFDALDPLNYRKAKLENI